MEYHRLNICGDVRIKSDRSLAEVATVLGAALGLTFVENPVGTFDEFPSFSATGAGLSFALLGIPHPDEQVSDNPIVDFSLQIDLAFYTLEAKEPCDASAYFSQLIANSSDLKVAFELPS